MARITRRSLDDPTLLRDYQALGEEGKRVLDELAQFRNSLYGIKTKSSARFAKAAQVRMGCVIVLHVQRSIDALIHMSVV